jgi:hypothetical protein
MRFCRSKIPDVFIKHIPMNRSLILLSLLVLLSFTMCNGSRPTSESPYPDGLVLPSDGFSLLNPFKIAIDPMERLLLVNIENDPDSVYIGFEPQVFDDSVNGRGMLVIAWRVDGMVDVYHQPGLRLDPGKYDIVGKGLAHMAEREMQDAFFRVDENGVQAQVEFEDLLGRAVHISIREENPRKRKPFGLLAPMGDAAENPSAMPLVLLHDFYFVRQKHTEISVRIDQQEYQVDKLPMPMDRTWMYFARYSPTPFIVTLNPAFSGILEPLPVEVGRDEMDLPAQAGRDVIDPDPGNLTAGTTGTVQLSWHGPVPGISFLKQSDGQHEITLAFDPPFPNLEALPDGANESGKFVVHGHPTTGKITGEYLVTKTGQRLHLEMVPSGGWIPNEKKLSVRIIYRMAGVFRKWPKTYRWTATVETADDGQAHMQSGWERIRKE